MGKRRNRRKNYHPQQIAPSHRQKGNGPTLTNQEVTFALSFIALIFFLLGLLVAFLYMHFVSTMWPEDTPFAETTTPEAQYTLVPEKQPEDSQEPSEKPSLPVTTPMPTLSSNPYSSNINVEPSANVDKNSDEYIMQNPKSSDRFDSIDFDNRKRLHDKLQRMYFDGEWDGEPMVYDGHYISLSGNGCICADMYPLNSLKTVDLPPNFDTSRVDSCNLEYIPGHGTYFVDEDTYYKYVKGEEFKLGTLNWMEGTGIDVDYHHPYIYYDEVKSKMFLWTPMIFSYDVVYDYTYLYVLPDYDVAKMEYIGKVNDFEFDEKGIIITDMDGYNWRFSA